MTTAEDAPPVAEEHVDLLLRQLHSAHWGGSAGHGGVLHVRLQGYAGSRSLFELQESLVRAAERMIGSIGPGRRITWGDVQTWAWYYGLRRPPLHLDPEVSELYSRRPGRRSLRARVAMLNEVLIPRIADAAGTEPKVRCTHLAPCAPNDSVPYMAAYRAAVQRARGEVAHGSGHNSPQARLWDFVLREVIEQGRTPRMLRDNPGGELSEEDRASAAEYLALSAMKQSRLRTQLRTLIGFHQQDVERRGEQHQPSACGVRWSLPPSEAHEQRERPVVGSSGTTLCELEDAVERLRPHLRGLDADDLVRVLYDRSSDLPHYAALTAQAIERYGSSARPPLDIPAYDIALAVDQVLLRGGFPSAGTPVGKALAQVDVAKLSVLLSSADPRALEYGQRALCMAAAGVQRGDRESVVLSMRAMRHMASVLRKDRNAGAARKVHQRMELLLGNVLGGAEDDRDRIRQQAIHFIHVSCTLPLRHRDLILSHGMTRPLGGDAVHEVWNQVEHGRRLLLELDSTDEDYRRAATVTRASLMRRIVELSALPLARGDGRHHEVPHRTGAGSLAARTDEARRSLAAAREAGGDPLVRLLAIRSGMHLAIALRDRDLVAALIGEMSVLRPLVPANAVIHRQLVELRLAAERHGLVEAAVDVDRPAIITV